MKLNKSKQIFIGMAFSLLATSSFASDDNHIHSGEHKVGPPCVGFGPQTPRDIDGKKGTNP